MATVNTMEMQKAWTAMDSGPVSNGKIALSILGIILVIFFSFLFISGIPLKTADPDTLGGPAFTQEASTSEKQEALNTVKSGQTATSPGR